jgi:hypothetical protein
MFLALTVLLVTAGCAAAPRTDLGVAPRSSTSPSGSGATTAAAPNAAAGPAAACHSLTSGAVTPLKSIVDALVTTTPPAALATLQGQLRAASSGAPAGVAAQIQVLIHAVQHLQQPGASATGLNATDIARAASTIKSYCAISGSNRTTPVGPPAARPALPLLKPAATRAPPDDCPDEPEDTDGYCLPHPSVPE